LPLICFIGVNPSTADETEDDPTIRREIAFAKREGFGGILKLNLYAYRATDPKEMWKAQKKGTDIIGGKCNWIEQLKWYVCEYRCKCVVAAWGSNGKKRGPELVRQWPQLMCFGKNDDGTPKHPLYLKSDTPIVYLTGAA
jgi:hypothetical protein